MAGPITIETDINGNPIQKSPPAITQSGQVETDVNGNSIPQKMAPVPSFQGPGPQLQERSNESLAPNGLVVPPLLNAIGGTAGALASPFTAGIANPVTGAMAGAGVAEWLKNKYPETFSETGKAPDSLDSAVNVGTAGLTEFGNQVGASAVKSLAGGTVKEDIARFLASKAGRAFPAVRAAAQKTDLGKSLLREETSNPNSEVRSLIGQHNISGTIEDTPKFLQDARDSLKKGKISQSEFDNLKSFADLSKTVNANDPSTMGGLFRRAKNDTLVMATGALTGNHYATGAATGIVLTNELLGYAASKPGMSNLIDYVKSHPDNDAVKKLAKQGILMALRGQEVTMLAPDGTKEKATISGQGMPQLAR